MVAPVFFFKYEILLLKVVEVSVLFQFYECHTLHGSIIFIFLV